MKCAKAYYGLLSLPGWITAWLGWLIASFSDNGLCGTLLQLLRPLFDCLHAYDFAEAFLGTVGKVR